MTDSVDPATRSRMMSRIRSTNTTPEVLVRKYLHAQGFRFRLHVPELPGKPDIVLPRYRAVVMVNGCFWHAHGNCSYFRLPTNNREFWETKLTANTERDTAKRNLLSAHGWRVATVWECLTRQEDPGLSRLADWLRSDDPELDLRS